MRLEGYYHVIIKTFILNTQYFVQGVNNSTEQWSLIEFYESKLG